MAENSKIEWTEATWNPTRGCSMAKGSESGGCLNCYAARMAARGLPGLLSPTTGQPFAIMRDSGPRWTGAVELIESQLDVPLHWRRPRRIFVDSMSDLFHEALPDKFIDRVFSTMAAAHWHTFQILTKRPDRMREYCSELRTASNDARQQRIGRRYIWPLPHMWLGTSVENCRCLWRIDSLRETPAAVRFLSVEPLLEDLGEIDLTGIHWVIVGGESGPGARPMHPEWARSVRDQCIAAQVPFFFKQWGEYCDWDNLTDETARIVDAAGDGHFDGMLRVGKARAGRLLDGREWSEMPMEARNA